MPCDTFPASNRLPDLRRRTTGITMRRPRSMSARRAPPRRYDPRPELPPAAGPLHSTAPAPQAPPPERRMAQLSPHTLDTAPRQLETTATVMLTDDAPRDRTPLFSRSNPAACHGMGSVAYPSARTSFGRGRLAHAGGPVLASRRHERC